MLRSAMKMRLRQKVTSPTYFENCWISFIGSRMRSIDFTRIEPASS